MKPRGQFCLWDGSEIQGARPCHDALAFPHKHYALLTKVLSIDYARQPQIENRTFPGTGLWESERECGSPQEFDEVCILCGFLKSNEFGLGKGQSLCFEQQIVDIAIAATAAQQCFDIPVMASTTPKGTLCLQ